ncbi:MAG: PD-(D/E)XK nuclease-like domain-containing protein [Desulfobacterium sp.]|nr:PD-(D/E)XK nuclease-like domain-containing protein [Desulfobacterium sp.]
MTPKRTGKLEITEEEYRKLPGLNFSSLAAFYNKGTYSPDHALMTFQFKSYFEFGKMFESLIQDMATGSKEFDVRFFQSTVDGTMPDDLIKWIDEKEDLENHYVYTQKGALSGTYKKRHAFLDEARAHPGKIPVSTKDWTMLHTLADRMMNMKYSDALVGDLLANAEFQVPIAWTSSVDGLDKKALIDCLVELNGEFHPFDIKTTADFKRFGYMLSDKYFIQEIHYTEGINEALGVCMTMPFLVASKEAPHLCQPWEVDYGDIDRKSLAHDEYHDLCSAYAKWIGDGRKPKGWLPLTKKKIYIQAV